MSRTTETAHAMEARRFRILQALYRNGLDWLDLGDLYLRIGESGQGTSDHGKVLARLAAEGYVEKRGPLPASGAPMEIRQASARITPAGRAHFRAELARLTPPKEHFEW